MSTSSGCSWLATSMARGYQCQWPSRDNRVVIRNLRLRSLADNLSRSLGPFSQRYTRQANRHRCCPYRFRSGLSGFDIQDVFAAVPGVDRRLGTLGVAGNLPLSHIPYGLLVAFCCLCFGFSDCFHGLLCHIFHGCHAGYVHIFPYARRWFCAALLYRSGSNELEI